jgi:hypothetical protein
MKRPPPVAGQLPVSLDLASLARQEIGPTEARVLGAGRDVDQVDFVARDARRGRRRRQEGSSAGRSLVAQQV